MPKKFIRCVKKVERSQRLHRGYKRVNPYAVCRVSTGYYGSSHHIGLKHKMTKDKFRINIPRKEVVVYDDSGRPLYPIKKKLTKDKEQYKPDFKYKLNKSTYRRFLRENGMSEKNYPYNQYINDMRKEKSLEYKKSGRIY